MDIKIIGSGSSGNCYKISDGKTALLLEAGLPIKKIKEGCDFDFSDVAGCLISHEHGDHSKSVKDIVKSGIDVWCSSGTANEINIIGNYHTRLMQEKQAYKIGSFVVVGFKVHHDAAEPFGYLIESLSTKEKLLFMTDCYYTDYKFPGLTHIMIEANYSADAIFGDPRSRRLRQSHMSIETCIKTLQANDLSNVKEIWLIHISSTNGDTEEFKRRVQEATGCAVHVS